MWQRNNWEGADSVYDDWLLSNDTPRKWFPYQKFISMFPEWETQRLRIYNKENLEQCLQSTTIKEGKFDFNDTMTSLSEKLSSSVIESASENENQNSLFSDNGTLPDSPIKRKRKRRCIQLICAEELSKEQPPASYKRNLDTVENGRNNEADDTERSFEKAGEEEEEQAINRQTDSKTKATMFYPLKVVEEFIVIESDDESKKILQSTNIRDVSSTTTKSKMEPFVTKIKSFQPLTFVTKSSILDFMLVLHMTLNI